MISIVKWRGKKTVNDYVRSWANINRNIKDFSMQLRKTNDHRKTRKILVLYIFDMSLELIYCY